MQTRVVWAVMTVVLLTSSSSSILLAGTATASDGGSASKIPPGVLAYLSARPGPSGCLGGVVTPFTISSVACNAGGIPPQTTTTLYPDCSGTGTNGCQVGTEDTASHNFAGFAGYTTVPSNTPNIVYYSTTTNIQTVAYWIGLQNSQDLLQAGIMYGANSNYDSQHPVMFVEYYESSGSCSSSFCGNTAPVSPGDSMYFEIKYYSSYGYWIVYSQDDSTNPWTSANYTVYYCNNCGGSYISYTSLPSALAVTEGQGATSSGYWPSGTLTFTDMVGYDANGNYQIGTSNWWYASPIGSAVTASLGESQYSCSWVGTQTTCQSTSIAIS